MSFLTTDDFNTRAYQEKIDAISEGDETLLQPAIDAAIKEAKMYLSRFDLTDLFGKTGDDRDPLLLLWLKDITMWQFIALANPGMDYDDVMTRRNNAIASLKQIQNSTAVPEGWLLLSASSCGPDPSTQVHVTSRMMRDTYR
jgi:hypothetical protein